MKTLYILGAKWNDKLGRAKKNFIVGVYDSISKLEQAKDLVYNQPHDYNSVSFSVKADIQPFHA